MLKNKKQCLLLTKIFKAEVKSEESIIENLPDLLKVRDGSWGPELSIGRGQYLIAVKRKEKMASRMLLSFSIFPSSFVFAPLLGDTDLVF